MFSSRSECCGFMRMRICGTSWTVMIEGNNAGSVMRRFEQMEKAQIAAMSGLSTLWAFGQQLQQALRQSH